MSVQLRGIHSSPAAQQSSQIERARSRDGEGRKDFAALLEQEAASPASVKSSTRGDSSIVAGQADASATRRPGTATTPTVPLTDGSGRSLPAGSSTGTDASGGNLAADGNEVTSAGTLSDSPRTSGMYVPPDFYHGHSYSPVFDHQDENGNWVATPRFEGQVVYSKWRGSLPPDYDPNARVTHDPLMKEQGARWWKQDESGNWVKREVGYDGIPLNDDGTPMSTPDPILFPEYYLTGSDTEQT